MGKISLRLPPGLLKEEPLPAGKQTFEEKDQWELLTAWFDFKFRRLNSVKKLPSQTSQPPEGGAAPRWKVDS